MNREQQLKLIWQKTHKDFKGIYEGVKTIMVCRQGSTTLVALGNLTEKEIADRLPKEVRS